MNSKKGLIISLLVFVVLLAVFTFTDWQISEALYNPEAGWANFMEACGQLPGAFLGVLSGSILIRLFQTKKSFIRVLGLIGLGLLTLLSSFGFFADVFGAQVDTEEINMLWVVILAVLVPVVLQLILHRFPREAVGQYQFAAQVGFALVILGGMAVVWLFKIPWGRWTFRDILEAGNPALFSPWYLPQGINGHHSFFSGHTAMSFSVIAFVLFAKQGSWLRKVLWGVFLAWGVVGGLSRIVVGAHFATDVLFGAGEVLLLFRLLQNKFQAKAKVQSA
jgi:membrane-associated phospholipid phosphatase